MSEGGVERLGGAVAYWSLPLKTDFCEVLKHDGGQRQLCSTIMYYSTAMEFLTSVFTSPIMLTDSNLRSSHETWLIS